MILNPNVNVDTSNASFDKFTPDEGYALWDDTEEGNIDPITGEPYCYWLIMYVPKNQSEALAPHIWAKLIDESMEVYGKPTVTPVPVPMSETEEKAAAYDVLMGGTE